ncbi:autoinducer binding domain-containing protein [Rhizobium halophilum]|uniref:autoinducer binding domain-containing protein n=1 Tax=Rhizobium halophilum TaxID=2846852 RepID=UPI001EFE23BE|nr:autoinducer binding domain-containing protein [Rhizobium halophilum]MCF6370863.1 autoinducer binding domain-containing protein [Rhizobium halophilum]
MDEWFDRLVEHVMLSRDPVTVRETLAKLASEAGFDHYAYLFLYADHQEVISNYRTEWQQRYFQRSYATIDPVIQRAWQRMQGFAWSSDVGSGSKQLSSFFGEAAEFGIRSGITIPIKTGFTRIALLTVASCDPQFAGSRMFNPISAAAAVAQVHCYLQMLNAQPTSQTKVDLKAVERVYLRWCAEGKRMRDIAVLENDSPGNVAFHLQNAKAAVGATTLPQATALGKELNLI